MQLTVQDAFALAAKHEAAGRTADARAIYDEILGAMPEHPGALLRIAQQELKAGDAARAGEHLELALGAAQRQSLPTLDILIGLARTYFARDDRATAKATLERALVPPPQRATTLTRLGRVALDIAEPTLAEKIFRSVPDADDAVAASGLALALIAQRRLPEATDVVRRGVERTPEALDLLRLLAYVELEQGRVAESQQIARRGLERHPQDVELSHLLGRGLRSAGAFAAARDVLSECVALAPDRPELRQTLAATCLDLGDSATARLHLERAIELGASEGETWDNLGIARRLLGEEEQAMAAFERAHMASPKLTPALANLVYAQQYLCEWTALETSERELTETLDDPDSDPRWPPFIALAMPLSSAQQLEVARRWSRAMLPIPVAPRRAALRSGRLRVGYLSGSFHEHPTARLMVGLFEEHDRSRFEVTGYSYGPDDGSDVRERVRTAFEHWRDVRDLSDEEIAQAIRDDGIDLLIDRKGHTQGSRMGILASRPAPVQIHYMSFPGTLGYGAVDGIIADAEVVPPEDDRYFHERVWRLPRSYYANDRRRGSPTPSSRADNGLPEQGLILACLNQSYKLRRPLFAIWMEALRARPDAVLWLLASWPRAQHNLCAEATRHGVDPRRLVFAPRVRQDAHMARLGCADLALDTLPYGAHTTGVDVLWAGVPMLTCRGDTFAGRVGASLLRAARMDRLITRNLADYRERLLELVDEPVMLRDFRLHLAETRQTNALFDTAGFARDWENLLLQIYDAAAGETATPVSDA